MSWLKELIEDFRHACRREARAEYRRLRRAARAEENAEREAPPPQFPVPERTDVVPSRRAWRREPWTLETPDAYAALRGKDHEAAGMILRRDGGMAYADHLMWMPTACFPFYTAPLIAFLDSPDAEGDASTADAFFGVMECRADEIRRCDRAFIDGVLEAVSRVADRQAWFDADESIFGSFTARAERLRTLIDGDGDGDTETDT